MTIYDKGLIRAMKQAYRAKYNDYKKKRMEEESRKKRSSDIQGQMELQGI